MLSSRDVSDREASRWGASRVELLGIPIDPVTPEVLLTRVSETAEASDRARLFFCLNVNYVNLAQGDPEVLKCFRGADTVYADGMGVVWGARLLGYSLPAKITVTDFVDPLCAKAVERGYSVFLLGGRPFSVEESGRRLTARYPGLQIVGMHHGFFTQYDEASLVKTIRNAAPKILLVGLGAPRQERWLMHYRTALPPCAALTCGALFDFVWGGLPRAPRWLTEHGLEWVWRLRIEPRRLWRRYLVGNPVFLFRVLRTRWHRGVGGNGEWGASYLVGCGGVERVAGGWRTGGGGSERTGGRFS